MLFVSPEDQSHLRHMRGACCCNAARRGRHALAGGGSASTPVRRPPAVPTTVPPHAMSQGGGGWGRQAITKSAGDCLNCNRHRLRQGYATPARKEIRMDSRRRVVLVRAYGGGGMSAALVAIGGSELCGSHATWRRPYVRVGVRVQRGGAVRRRENDECGTSPRFICPASPPTGGVQQANGSAAATSQRHASAVPSPPARRRCCQQSACAPCCGI